MLRRLGGTSSPEDRYTVCSLSLSLSELHGVAAPWSSSISEHPFVAGAVIQVLASHVYELHPLAPKSFRLHFDSILVASWLSGSMRCKETGPREAMQVQLDLLWRSCRNYDWSFAGRSWASWIPRSQNIFADWLANVCVDSATSYFWQTSQPVDLADCFLLGYADGACKGCPGRGASSYAVLSVHVASGRAALVVAGARYWHTCTAIQAEIAGAGYLCRVTHDLIQSGRAVPLHNAATVTMDLKQGMKQLNDTLLVDIAVAGTFQDACF